MHLLSLLLLLVAAAAPADDFLLPDQAFRVSGQAEGPESVVVSWDIADGYYMYRTKFRFRSASDGITLGNARSPAGETRHDEFFGEMEIYRDRVEIELPITRQAGAGNKLTLEATSQGCADAGFCYPPHKQTIQVALPKLAALSTPEPGARPSPASAQPALGALSALNRSLGLGADDDILPPEEAFQLSSELTGPNEVRLVWDIAPETYLYQEKIALAIADSSEVAIGDYVLPEAVIKPDSVRPDGTVGDTAVYHNRIDLRVPLVRSSPEATSATLVVSFQGCAERGICYPPMTERIALALPATTAVSELPVAGAAQSAPDQPVSEQDQIAAALAGGNLWAVVALFFGFGLLLAFTPCVFPMIPILSGIIAGQGPNITTRKAFTLSLVYVLAMAATYTVAGVLAGLFGANLQAAFQNVWILFTFALVFVALAMSMFGFYELQLPSSLQSKLAEISNRQEGGTLIGVAIMGLLSALIVGPCVAPPLAGALIFIGQTGDAVLGGLALFALSMGMGAPLIAIGTSAGKLLPRAGAWMDAVKAVFGVLLLAVAIWLVERVIPAAAAMVLWALLLICSAVYMGALQQVPPGASGWTKLWKGLGLVLLVYGVLMLVGAAAGGKDSIQPLRGLAVGGGAAQAHAEFRRIKTVDDLDREVATAAAAGKPVLLDFYADWCVACKELERYTFSDPAVIKEMERFVLLQADVTANDEADKALLQGRFGLPGPPAIMVYDRSGQELRGYRLVGFKPAAEFAEHLRRAVP